MKKIIHIHVPKTGGTWLNKTLEKYTPDFFIKHTVGNGNRCSLEDPLFWRGRYNPPGPIWHNGDYPSVRAARQIPDMSQFAAWNEAHKVSICRNPFDYLVSSYHFNDSGNKELTNRWYLPEGVSVGAGLSNVRHGISSWEEYVQKFCDPGFPWGGGGETPDGQRYFLFHQMFNHDGTCGVNKIIRQEKLSAGTAEMLRDMSYIDDAQYSEIVNSKKENVEKSKKQKDYRSFYTDALREAVERKFRAELLLFGYDFDGPTDDSPYVDPKSLFYHAVVPFAGKYLGEDFARNYDHGMREWLRCAADADARTTFDDRLDDRDVGWQAIDYIRGSQSPYPNTAVRLKYSTVTHHTGDTFYEPMVTCYGNPTGVLPFLEDWNKERGVKLCWGIDGTFNFTERQSAKDVFSNNNHPYSRDVGHKNWRHMTGDEGNHWWNGKPMREVVPQITRAILEAEKKSQ